MSQVDLMTASIVRSSTELGGENIHPVGICMSQERKDYTAAIFKRVRDLVTSILGFYTSPDVAILVKKHEGIFSEPDSTFSQYQDAIASP